MQESSLFEEFIQRMHLEDDAQFSYDPEEATLVISAWRIDGPLIPPVRLTVNEDILSWYLPSLYKSAVTLWSDSDQVTGAFNLLFVHIDETILTRKPGQNNLILDQVSHTLEWAK